MLDILFCEMKNFPRQQFINRPSNPRYWIIIAADAIFSFQRRNWLDGYKNDIYCERENIKIRQSLRSVCLVDFLRPQKINHSRQDNQLACLLAQENVSRVSVRTLVGRVTYLLAPRQSNFFPPTAHPGWHKIINTAALSNLPKLCATRIQLAETLLIIAAPLADNYFHSVGAPWNSQLLLLEETSLNNGLWFQTDVKGWKGNDRNINVLGNNAHGNNGFTTPIILHRNGTLPKM